MIAIAVDDEFPMLMELVKAVKASPDIEQVKEFSSCNATLEWAQKNPVDIAFLDINMRGMGGLALAEKLQQLHPSCGIVFCTGYTEYAVEAFRIHVNGYLLKPITAQQVQREIDHFLGVQKPKQLLEIRCFGNFEVFAHGQPVQFKRTKAKELLAYLVDRNGAGVTARQICTALWEDGWDDSRNMNYLRQLFSDLRIALRTVGAEEVLQSAGNHHYLDMSCIQCDYAQYLKTGRPAFFGEYMSQYAWAENTCAMLNRK